MGFGKDFLMLTVAAVLGGGVSAKSQEKKSREPEKLNLLGSAGCIIGRKNGGFTNQSCLGCPLASKCAQHNKV